MKDILAGTFNHFLILLGVGIEGEQRQLDNISNTSKNSKKAE